jgi:hypothetical protein
MTTPSMVTLLNAVHRHMTACVLPEPVAVTVDPSPVRNKGHVAVHLSPGQGMPVLAAQLLTWADSLTEVRASVWRTPDGQALHVSVVGLLTDGHTALETWGAVTYHPVWCELDSGQRRPVTLGRLREWAAHVLGVSA